MTEFKHIYNRLDDLIEALEGMPTHQPMHKGWVGEAITMLVLLKDILEHKDGNS